MLMFVGLGSFGQSFVKGHVSDSSGIDLGGVSVFTSDRLNSAISDENGNYKLKLPSDKTFIV